MPLPRVLLLEDDPAIRRFVQLALNSLSIDLVSCASLGEARQELARAPIALLLTDLALPDGSGREAFPPIHPDGTTSWRTVVFSGGVDTALQQQPQALGVWRVLHKPVAVADLQRCVSEALNALPDSPHSQPAVPAQRWASETNTDPVAAFFGGNHSLYDNYRGICLRQFPQDVRDGDAALRAGDSAALRRIAHNLKSALTLLGLEHAAQLARNAEESAMQGTPADMRMHWQRLRQQVKSYASAQLPV